MSQSSKPFVLRDYALLADGQRAALVGPDGNVAWMCFPGFADDALFADLLGGGGYYSITPESRYVWGGHYEHGLIWRDRWIAGDDVVECREALAYPGRRDRAVLLRRVLPGTRATRLRVALDLRGCFGSEAPEDVHCDDAGVWRARVGTTRAAWSGAAEARARGDGDGGTVLELELELDPGRPHDLVLVLEHGGDGPQVPDPDLAWSGTERAWIEHLPQLPEVQAQRDARLACAVIRGLTADTGGTVAAATTSLPERARAGRNFDYRYVWIRDQCYAGHAAARARLPDMVEPAVRFVTERLLQDGRDLRAVYTTAGERVQGERGLPLPGYPGGDAIAGNRAGKQFQLDAFGEALLLLAAADELELLDAERWTAVDIAAEAIAERWEEPDAGVWELDARCWTHSRLICAAGLRAVAARQPAASRGGSWLALADRIVARAAAEAVHGSGRWQRAPDDDRVDASLVLAAVRGALPAGDPRSVATLHAVVAELADDGYCYRYRPDARPLGEAEGAFLLCGFWLALAWAQHGDLEASAQWFERNRAACGSPGMFTEEFDVRQRQLRGNLPQTFVHALLLEAAVAQAEARA